MLNKSPDNLMILTKNYTFKWKGKRLWPHVLFIITSNEYLSMTFDDLRVAFSSLFAAFYSVLRILFYYIF